MSTAQKISQLTTAGPLTGAELVPIVQTSGTLQTTVSTIAAFAVVSIIPVVSALGTQIAQVSAIAAANTTAITSVQADVSALTIRTASVSAVTSVNSAAITSINNVVSALDVRVSVLEVAVSNIGNVSAIATLVSAVASLESTVSALVIQTAAVSALTSVNSAAITSINAVVSTKVNRVGDFLTSVQYIDFNVSTSYAPAAGRLTWDIASGTLDLGLTGTVNLLIGQRTVCQVYNNSGVTLPKDKAVRVTGAQGQRLTAALAEADNDADSATIFGIMLETVSNLGTGYAATDGLVKNFNTSGYTDGQIIYLSPVSAGELTPTKPVAPQHMVMMGYIVNGNSVGGGSIYVKIQNGYELGELHDVKTSASASIANNEVLAWNTSAGVWTNSTVLLDVQASVSALNVQIASVSADTSALSAQIAAVSALTSVNAAAITSTNAVVSALDVRVGLVSAATSVNAAAITSANVVIAAVSALTSVNAVQIAAVSALTSVNAVAIAAVAASVSVLQIQVDAVSAATSVNAVAIAAVSAAVSTLQVQVNTVSAAVSAALVSVSQRVLKAGDSMTGELNNQDNLVTRPKFKDYSLQAVVKTSVSATTTLDLTEGNFFTVLAGGSTTYVFANPPVSSANGPAAGGFVLELQNGGAATVTWPSTVDWPGGTAPTLTTSGYDVIVCITDDGGTNWRCVQSMKDSK
jgi:hypothetical protein